MAVTLVLGASGVGKSRVAVPLAARYGVRLCEIDDIVTALRALTVPETHPVLHYAVTQPDMATWSAERITDHHLAFADSLRPGVSAVIADHIEYQAPLVIEGDYLTPDIVTDFGPEVRAVVLHEPDAARIATNLAEREPGTNHTFRAAVSLEIGRRLAERAEHCGVPVIAPRPWHDVVDRVAAALAVTPAGRP